MHNSKKKGEKRTKISEIKHIFKSSHCSRQTWEISTSLWPFDPEYLDICILQKIIPLEQAISETSSRTAGLWQLQHKISVIYCSQYIFSNQLTVFYSLRHISAEVKRVSSSENTKSFSYDGP